MTLYLCVRIEPVENRHLSDRDGKPALAFFSKRFDKPATLGHRDIAALAEKHGWEMTWPGWKNAEVVMFAYLSPNSEGKGRSGSQLFRVAGRRASRPSSA